MSYNRTDDLLERLLNAVEGGGIGGGRGGMGRGSQPSNEEINTLLQRSKEAAKEFNSLKNGIRFTTRQQQAFGDATSDANARLGEINRVLSLYRNNQISLSTQQKKQLEAERARLASLEDGNKGNAAFVAGVQQVRQNLEQFGTQMIQGNAQVVQAIQSGASGFTIAGQSMIASMQLQNTAVQTMTGLATQAGGALMNFGGIVGKIAGAGIVLGAQFMGLQSALKTQAKQLQIQTLMAGGEQILKAYQEMTAAGASYVGGLQRVQSALKGSDYTLQDFSSMVKANSETLAKANMSVSEAALMFGRVGAIFDKDGKKMRRELLALGFNYQEQGALMAEVMADMRRQDPTAKLAENEVALRTREYAVHLATIADLTGKNARQLMEEGRKKTAQLAFQNFLQTFTDPKIRARVEEAVAGIADPVLRQNIMERLTFGGVINKTGATLEAINPALEAMSIELANAAKQGKGAEDFFKIQEKFSKKVNDGFLNNREFNLAAAAPGSKIEALGNAAAETRTYVNQMGTAAKTFAEKNLIGTKPEATTGLAAQLIDMTIIGKELEKALQEGVIARLHILKGHLQDYNAKLKSILDAEVPSAKAIMEKQLNMMKDFAREYWEKIKAYAKEYWNDLGVWTKAAIIGGGVIVGLIGTFYLLGKAAAFAKTVLDGYRFATGRGLPGTGGTVESGRGRPGPGGRVPGGGGSVPVPGGGGGFGPPGKFESFIFNIMKSFGQGAGAIIRGIMTGIAGGIAAFSAPGVLKGAAILAGAILVIGAAIAGATWLMGGALNKLHEGLSKYQEINGEKLTQAGNGMLGLAKGIGAFALLGVPSTISAMFTALGEGILNFFGGKTPLQKMVDFAKHGPELEKGAKGLAAFVSSMKQLEEIDGDRLSKLATGMSALQAVAKSGGVAGVFSDFFGGSEDPEKIRNLADALKGLQGGGQITNKEYKENGKPMKQGYWNGLKTYQEMLLVSISTESINALKSRGGIAIINDTKNAPPNQTAKGAKQIASMDTLDQKLGAILAKNTELTDITNKELIQLVARLVQYEREKQPERDKALLESIKQTRALYKM